MEKTRTLLASREINEQKITRESLKASASFEKFTLRTIKFCSRNKKVDSQILKRCSAQAVGQTEQKADHHKALSNLEGKVKAKERQRGWLETG